jgi:hypothetical protein
MGKIDKERLKSLGIDRLTDLLFDIAQRDDAIEKRLLVATASNSELAKKVRSQISGLKRIKKFYDWKSVRNLCEKVELTLEAIEMLDVEPAKGFEIVVSFFETDNSVYGNCDDSSGTIADLYTHDAVNQLIRFGKQCDDKPWLADQIFELNQSDDYGVRDCTLAAACEFLPESETRKLINRYCELAAEQDQEDLPANDWNRPSRRYWCAAEALAKGINDGSLYEMAKKSAWGKADLNAAAWNDIAKVYLKADDPKTALQKLANIKSNDHFKSYETEQIRIETHEALGNTNEVSAILQKRFLKSPSSKTLGELSELLSAKKLKAVVAELLKNFNDDFKLDLSFLEFALAELDLKTAEKYLLARFEQIDGERYYILPDLAKQFAAKNSSLAATLIFRALADSILKRAVSKNYKIAVGYIKRMAKLDESITNWKKHPTHEDYLNGLRENHSRKSAFWSKMK